MRRGSLAALEVVRRAAKHPQGHLSCVEELRIGARPCCPDAAGKVIASKNDALVPKDGGRRNVAAIDLTDGPKVEQAHGALHLRE